MPGSAGNSGHTTEVWYETELWQRIWNRSVVLTQKPVESME
jgi:hypothetical protein